MLDVIKEYLISLGFKVDNASLNKANSAMGQAEKIIGKFAGSATLQFAAAGAAVTTFVAAANLGIAKFIGNLAKSDLEAEKFARKMWTSKENALAFKSSLDAMGATLEDLYLSPELMERFIKLKQQATEMRPTNEYYVQMKSIREIGFEFQRLKLEVSYAMQWIGYYIIKYLEKPINDFKKNFKSFNDYLQKELPKWTKPIGQVLSWVVRLGIAFAKIPTSIKLLVAALLSFNTIISIATSPITLWIAGLTTLLLLLDDFYTYQSGGESQFEGLWKWIDKLSKDKAFSDFSDNIKDIWTNVRELAKSIGELLDEFSKSNGFSGFTDFFSEAIIDSMRIVNDLITRAIYGYRELAAAMKGDWLKVDELDKELKNRIYDIWKNYGSYLQKNQSYIQPQSTGKTIVNQNNENTFHIYGSEPSSTAQAVSSKMDGIYTRNFQGVLI